MITITHRLLVSGREAIALDNLPDGSPLLIEEVGAS